MTDLISKEKRSVFLSSEEGSIFVSGCVMFMIWITACAILWNAGSAYWLKLLTMGFTHAIAGRAASIAHATSTGLTPGLTTGLAIYFDVMMMFIIYPVLVYSYKHFLEERFFKKHVKPVFDSAKTHLTRFRKAKIAGVFLFVWFPLWMTGIITGAVLGFLLGLRTWVTLTTVILGSSSAVICWVYAYDKLFGWLGNINKAVPVAVTVLIVTILAILRILQQKSMNGKSLNNN